MSVQAKVIIDHQEINLLYYDYGFNQKTDISGRPCTKPVFVGLTIEIESRRDIEFAEWAFAANQTKQIELHITPVLMGGKTRKLYFYDCHLLNWKNHFISTGNQPMSETLYISAAGVKDTSSTAEYSTYWRTTFPQQEVEPIAIENSPEVLQYYITDLEGNEIDKYEASDKIILNLETKNCIGKKLTVKIPDKTYDFKHNGIHLQNDTLKDYIINSDVEKVELEVIEQKS